MATVEKDLLFESFLKKRKDTMKFTWSKYWFRLQNTTLSFFTSSEADPACLRGKYYIYLVQSVREVKGTDSNFTFEITMKNGKRKLLAAETAELRAIWMEFLWKSMQLPAPGRKNSSCTWHDIPSLEERAQAALLSRCQSRSELDGAVYEMPDLLSHANVFHPENESSSEDEDSAVYDVPTLKSESNKTETEKTSCSEYRSLDIYDIPKSKSVSDTKTAALQDPDDDDEDISILPMMNNMEIRTPIFQGELIDDDDGQSTLSNSLCLDENYGVSRV